MKYLDEVIEAIKAEDVDIFIGASSAWLFIGSKTQYESEIDKLSESILKKHKRRLKEYKHRLQFCLDNPRATYPIHYTGKTYYRPYKAYTKMLSKNIHAYDAMCKNWIPLRNRLVLDVYMKEAEEGLAIIIEGNEAGEYWLKGEANERRILRDAKSITI